MDGLRDRPPDGGTRGALKIWIDLGNSPHVPFFKVLAEEFLAQGHEVVWTARDYAQTVEMARAAGLDARVFGTHGGKRLLSKAASFAKRVIDLTRWARGREIDLVLSHNSQEPLVAARALGIRSVNLMDYEHHPGNHLSFRAARHVIVPEAFPEEAIDRFGAAKKIGRFAGIKEDVYLADFQPDPSFQEELKNLGISEHDILAVVRPHAPEALYHRDYVNRLLGRLIDQLSAFDGVKILLLPRKVYQGDALRADHPQANVIIPKGVLDGGNLLAAADIVVSGGGTMNREAAALGVPAYTVFAGREAAVDRYLIESGRLRLIQSEADIERLIPVKKSGVSLRSKTEVRRKLAELILNCAE